VTISFAPVPAGVYLRAIADTHNVKFSQTQLDTWDFSVGPVAELSAVIVPRFVYFHVVVEMRFLASNWEQVPFPKFYNTSCSATRGLNCGVYAPFSLIPAYSIISIDTQSRVNDESIFSYAAISLSSYDTSASVSLTVTFNVGPPGASSYARGIKRIRIAGLAFASFVSSGEATCSNAKNPRAVGGVTNALVEGYTSSLSIVFNYETFVLNPGSDMPCTLFGYSNLLVPKNATNSVVISTYDLAGNSIQYKPFIEFPQIVPPPPPPPPPPP
jgi:hypothetical protein